MNTYTDNMQQSISGILNNLDDQQQKLESIQTAAEYTLYYAQGAERTAREKLQATQVQVKETAAINDQAVINNNQVLNLLASATESKANVGASVINMATAASNVQIASNAIALLASDIGAALNIASASLFDTEIYKKISHANSYINEVANDAKQASLQAMDASSKIAEVSASDVLNQVQVAKAQINDLQKASLADFNQYSALATAESQTVGQTSQAEKQAEGSLRDADKEYAAITTVYANANTQLNLDLVVNVFNGQQISVSFTPLALPLPQFHSKHAATLQMEAPQAAPTYYLVLVPYCQSKLVNNDLANQLFTQDNGNAAPFYPVTFDINASTQSTTLQPALDLFGTAVVPGKPYVVYVYAELSTLYKRYINNFDDFLSAPSQQFTMATSLPKAYPTAVQAAADKSNVLLSISAPAPQNSLGSTAIAAMSTAESAQMTTVQIAAMLPDLRGTQFASLSTSQLVDITTNDIAQLDGAQVAALSTAQIAVLTSTQLSALNVEALGGLNSTQLHALTTNQLGGLTTTQVVALNTAQIAALSQTQMQALHMPSTGIAGAISELTQAVVNASDEYQKAILNLSQAKLSAHTTEALASSTNQELLDNQNSLTAATAEQNKLTQELNNLNQMLTGHTQQQSITKTKLSQAKATYDSLQPSPGTKPDSAQKASLSQAKEALEAATEANNFINNQITIAKQAISELTAKQNESADKITDLNGKNASLTSTANSTQNAANAAASQYAAAQRNVQATYAIMQEALQAQNIASGYLNTQNQVITFYVNLAGIPRTPLQFRCILVEMLDQTGNAPPPGGYLLSPELNNPTPTVYFNLEIAKKVTAANFTLANFVANDPVAIASASTVHAYSVSISPSATDNFGNPLRPGSQYLPCILSVLDEEIDGAEIDNYAPTLSGNLPLWPFQANN